MLGTVGVTLVIIVLVASGERQTRGGIGGQGALQVAHGFRWLDVQGVFGVLCTHSEGHDDGLRLVLPVRELDLEDVVAALGQGVDVFQSQPEFP